MRTELEGSWLAPGLVPMGTEREGRRLPLMLVPAGAVPLDTGTGEIDGVDCGTTAVVLAETAPYPGP